MMGVSEDVSWFVTNANPLERNNESSNEDFDPLEKNKESLNENFDGGDALNHTPWQSGHKFLAAPHFSICITGHNFSFSWTNYQNMGLFVDRHQVAKCNSFRPFAPFLDRHRFKIRLLLRQIFTMS